MARWAAVTPALAATPVTPRPTEAGVLGMARAMEVAGRRAAMSPMVLPAMMESTSVPAPTSGAMSGAAWSSIAMTGPLDGTFRGTIPGQLADAVVQFYVAGVDGAAVVAADVGTVAAITKQQMQVGQAQMTQVVARLVVQTAQSLDAVDLVCQPA